MALFFMIMLGVSIVGMSALLGFKRYELAGGRIMFASVRPAVGTFFKHTLWWIEKVLPALVRVYGRRAIRFSKVLLQRTIAKSILAFEHGLERVLHTVREQTKVPRVPGEASPFLREVAEHKLKLSRRTRTPKEVPVTASDVEQLARQKSEFEVE